MAIAIDSTAEYLFVDDTSIGVVSVFVIQSDGSLAYSGSFGTGQSRPIGIGAVNDGGNSGNNYVFTANMDGNFVQPYLRSAATLTQQASVSDKTGPTGLVIDPEGLFAYTGNSGNGTIGLIGIEKQPMQRKRNLPDRELRERKSGQIERGYPVRRHHALAAKTPRN